MNTFSRCWLCRFAKLTFPLFEKAQWKVLCKLTLVSCPTRRVDTMEATQRHKEKETKNEFGEQHSQQRHIETQSFHTHTCSK
jgi:hypothetical protein